MAATPHLFGQRPALHVQPYLVIPGVSSELRDFYPVRRVEPEVIASNATFTASDPTGLLFAVISSSMFMAWQASVGGRLKSDLRFSNTIVWNNLPLPRLTEQQRAGLVEAGRSLEAARAAHPDRTLASLYQRGAMPADLAGAHADLDRFVDESFDLTEGATTAQRQRVLFTRYAELSALGGLLSAGSVGRIRGRRK